MTSKPTTIGTFDMGTSLQVPRHQQIVTIETEAELCCGNPARWSTRLKFVQICGALVALRPIILASEWVAARIGRSEMGEGPTNPVPRRTRPTKPLPEPADATFTVLLQEAAQSGSRRRRAWAQLIDHLIAGERDAEQEELRGLIAYCHERVDLLNSRDADFIVSIKRIVERYAVTPRCTVAMISSIQQLPEREHTVAAAAASAYRYGCRVGTSTTCGGPARGRNRASTPGADLSRRL